MALVVLVATPTSVEADERWCGRTNDSVRKLLECVTVEGVLEHQQAFAEIADANGGTRSAGTPGYDASVDYVEDRLTRAGYVVTRQTFNVFSWEEVGDSALEQTSPTPETYVEGTDFAATPHSEPGDVTASVTPVDIQLGLGNTSTSGCEAADFAGFPAGDIALIQRGTCTFELKAENAAAAGASGVLLFNQGNTTDAGRQGIPAVTLGNDYTAEIPALSATYALGAELAGIPDLEIRLFANVSRTPHHAERHRRVARRRREQRDHGRRPPRLGARGSRYQRQRVRVQRSDRGRRADRQAEAAQQGALRLVGRRGSRPDRLAQLRPLHLRRRRLGLRARRPRRL
ncbi:hypothetical protein D0Z08_16770 [Nocardioides immobilis]|uniref:PA domain-containing protein n=1 Tax=Nocardioides immobilis TaxID=2049295 RepID=A0A417Y068_9ACTN|nr:hypothetical protein D0Z08_16770 [Nocardioides immobilis]